MGSRQRVARRITFLSPNNFAKYSITARLFQPQHKVHVNLWQTTCLRKTFYIYVVLNKKKLLEKNWKMLWTFNLLFGCEKMKHKSPLNVTLTMWSAQDWGHRLSEFWMHFNVRSKSRFVRNSTAVCLLRKNSDTLECRNHEHPMRFPHWCNIEMHPCGVWICRNPQIPHWNA